MTAIKVGATSGAGDLLSLGYTYGTTTNNGNLASQSITFGSTLLGTQDYGYDDWNRLKTAVETKGISGTAWSQTYVYDQFGNRADGRQLELPADDN